MTAPDRIWAYPSYVTGWNSANAHDRPIINATEYVRRDPAVLAALPEVQALVDALRQCRDELDEYSRQEYPLDHPVHERYRQRDYDANPARVALAKWEDAIHKRGE